MEYLGSSQGFIKMDAKTNKTHGFEHFTCNPLRDPHFQKICTKINQWDHGPESIFPSTGRENLPPWSHSGLFSKICYNILQLQQVLVHKTTEAKKLMGGERFRQLPRLKRGIFFFIFVQGTLQGLETSAVRSQSFNLERELPEF